MNYSIYNGNRSAALEYAHKNKDKYVFHLRAEDDNIIIEDSVLVDYAGFIAADCDILADAITKGVIKSRENGVWLVGPENELGKIYGEDAMANISV